MEMTWRSATSRLTAEPAARIEATGAWPAKWMRRTKSPTRRAPYDLMDNGAFRRAYMPAHPSAEKAQRRTMKRLAMPKHSRDSGNYSKHSRAVSAHVRLPTYQAPGSFNVNRSSVKDTWGGHNTRASTARAHGNVTSRIQPYGGTGRMTERWRWQQGVPARQAYFQEPI